MNQFHNGNPDMSIASGLVQENQLAAINNSVTIKFCVHFVHGDKGIVFLYCSANVNYTPDIQINFDYCNSSCPHCLQLFCCLAVFRILNERIITEFFLKVFIFSFIQSIHIDT